MNRNKVIVLVGLLFLGIIILSQIIKHKTTSITPEPYISQNKLRLAKLAEINYEIYNKVKSDNIINSNGQKDGDWTLFYDINRNQTDVLTNFAYYRTFKFKNGKLSENWTEYTIYGIQTFSGKHISKDGKTLFDGVCTWYDDVGRIRETKSYKNGKLNGKSILFFENGSPKIIENYKNEILHGKRTEYGKPKIISAEENFINDYKSGICKYYDDGLVTEVRTYSRNKLNGAYKEYYKSGKIKVKGNYTKGEETGNWYYYDEDGDYEHYAYRNVRVGAICRDGHRSYSTGRGTCSWHGGVAYWLTDYIRTYVGGTGKHSRISYY